MVSTTTARSLLAANINDNTVGDITPAELRAVFSAVLDGVDLAASGGSVDISKGQIAGELTAPGNRTYTIDLSAPFPYTINTLVTQLTAGTCTVAVQIGGVNVTGLSAVAATTTLTTSTATAANAVAANAKVTLVVSNVAGASELAFALKFTRT